MSFAATYMQLEIIILSELNQKEKDKYFLISLICGIENMTQMSLPMKLKQNRQMVAKGQGLEKGWSGRWGSADASFYM